MIKANELRIGNYVDLFGVKQIDSIIRTTTGDFRYIICEKKSEKIKLCEGCLEKSTEFKPIPLTEEWLLNFGFEIYFYGGQGNVYHYGKLGSIEVDLLTGLYDNGNCVINRRNSLKYVHQLQNLYFALTNDELTINDSN